MVKELHIDRKDRTSLTSKIFYLIREDILSGKYKEGEKIVETKLGEELGVSRTPIREALKQLELDGLVENIPNKGVIVKGISKEDIYDIYTIRLGMEEIAVKLAMERMNEDDLNSLKEIYELMEFYTFKEDVEKISELNTKFHETIYNATKSRYLEQLLKDFQCYIKSTRIRSLKIPGRLESALVEHKAILDAFIDRNVDMAINVLEKHINTSKNNIDKL